MNDSEETVHASASSRAARPTAASVSKEVEDLRDQMASMKEQLEELKTDMPTTMREAMQDALSAWSQSKDNVSVPNQPIVDHALMSNVVPVKDLFEQTRFERVVRDAMRGNEIRGPRDLRFMNTYRKWMNCTHRFPEEWARDCVVFAFSGPAEHMINDAFMNGELKRSATSEDMWCWAQERFWSESIVSSIRSEYRSRRLQRNENLSAFHRDLREIGAALGMTEADLKVDFVEGLPKRYQPMARLHSKQEQYEGLLHEMLKEHGERLTFSDFRFRSPSVASIRQNNESPSLPEHGGDYQEGLLPRHNEAISPASDWTVIAEHVAQILEKRQDSSVCYRCKQPGHWARECQETAPVQASGHHRVGRSGPLGSE